MWIGEYIRWNPVPEYEGKRFEVEAVHDDWDGFRIWFRPYDTTQAMLIAHFEYPLFYSSSDEGDRLDGATNELSLEFPHLFWKVRNSDLVKEFKRQSGGVRAQDPMDHFCFLSCNQCVDVLAAENPSFRGLPTGGI